jgi:hypothetical protein
MKTTKTLTLIAATMLLALASCKPVDDPQQVTKNVVVTTADPAFITSGTATLGAEVTADDAGLLLELGVCWSKTGTPTIDGQCAKTYRCSQPYQCFIASLEPNTQYHVRGFAKYGTEYCYGDEKTFTTLGSDAPSASPVTTLEATEITYESFCAAYSIVPFGVTNYTAGLIYSTNPDLTLENCEGIKTGYYDSETDSYLVCCYDLTPNTKYYYRAFVEYYTDDQPAYFYGEVLSLTTPEMPFIINLETLEPEYYWSYYTIAHGRIECTMPEVVDQLGFCYSKDNEYPQFESDFHTTAATPTGNWHWYEFDSYIDNLSAHTKYYIRSYARYKTDSIKYGNVVSIDIN